MPKNHAWFGIAPPLSIDRWRAQSGPPDTGPPMRSGRLHRNHGLIAQTPSRLKRPLIGGATIVIALAAVSTFFSVNIFPVLTNDTLTYLGYSNDLREFGLVHVGYRQFGYPLFLALTDGLARWLTIEPLLFAAFVQRLILGFGLVYAAWLWRWWSLPLVVFALSAEMVAYTNLMLTEGLTVPLALILVCLTAHFLMLVGRGKADASKKAALALVGAIALVSLGLLAIRFPFAVFGVCPLAAALAARKTNLSRVIWAVFGMYALAAIGILGLISLENLREYGEFSPSTRGARTEYWSVWTNVFTLDPHNAEKPRLEEFYDDGDPYVLIGEIDSMDIPYEQQAVLYEKAIEDLLDTAGIDPWESRLESFLGAIRGGRLDDIEGIIAAVLSSDRTNLDGAIHRNVFSREQGAEAFADTFNGGQLPDGVITAPLALRFPLPAARELAAILLPLSLLALVWGLLDRNARLLAVSSLAAIVSYSALIGYIWADNFRFLTTTTVFGIASTSAFLALRDGPGGRRRRMPDDGIVTGSSGSEPHVESTGNSGSL